MRCVFTFYNGVVKHSVRQKKISHCCLTVDKPISHRWLCEKTKSWTLNLKFQIHEVPNCQIIHKNIWKSSRGASLALLNYSIYTHKRILLTKWWYFTMLKEVYEDQIHSLHANGVKCSEFSYWTLGYSF